MVTVCNREVREENPGKSSNFLLNLLWLGGGGKEVDSVPSPAAETGKRGRVC